MGSDIVVSALATLECPGPRPSYVEPCVRWKQAAGAPRNLRCFSV